MTTAKARPPRHAYQQAYQRQARALNPEKNRAAVARYRVSHAEQERARKAKYRAEHPEQNRAQASKRRALSRDAFVEDVDIERLVERDRGLCGICGEEVAAAERSVDHILPLVEGGLHSYANTRLAHRLCNIRRQHRGAAQLRMLG